jgi:hypothetical protein
MCPRFSQLSHACKRHDLQKQDKLCTMSFVESAAEMEDIECSDLDPWILLQSHASVRWTASARIS